MVKYFIIITLIFCYSSACSQIDSINEMGYPFEDIPVFNGDLRLFVQNNIIYPKSAINDSVEGKVYIKYMVDTAGFTKKHIIEKGIREDLNNEALRITRLIKYDKPAMIKGIPIIFYYTLPVEFKLPEKPR